MAKNNRNIKWVGAVCAASLLLELVFYRKSHFGAGGLDATFSFYAVLGFLSCVLCIWVAKGLGTFLSVKENYYEKKD